MQVMRTCTYQCTRVSLNYYSCACAKDGLTLCGSPDEPVVSHAPVVPHESEVIQGFQFTFMGMDSYIAILSVVYVALHEFTRVAKFY